MYIYGDAGCRATRAFVRQAVRRTFFLFTERRGAPHVRTWGPCVSKIQIINLYNVLRSVSNPYPDDRQTTESEGGYSRCI